MSIQNFIQRQLSQKCVYWGSPAEDGEGGNTYASPVEIDCRWENMTQIVVDSKGNEITSRALVFVEQDLDVEGRLYLGTLENLYDLPTLDSSASELNDPAKIENTFIIKRFQKTPALNSTTEFLRKAYLTPSLSFGGF
jgi:hypothetical protein